MMSRRNLMKGSLWVRIPPVKPGQQPEPSVAWWWGNPPCEAYTGSVEAVLSSSVLINARGSRS